MAAACVPVNRWKLDLDGYLNPFLPPSPLSRLPGRVSYWLGYRTKGPRPLGNIVIVFWAFVGVFVGVSVIELVSRQVPSFQDHGAPIIIGSFGAAAVLEFYAIESPLAQPRNAVLGQLLSSVTGVAVCRLFALSASFQSLRWLAAALACASATAVMALTGTVHPPAGATALIAIVDDGGVRLGWYLVPVILLGCALMQCVALLVNNVQRRFPTYWWTPEEVGQHWRRRRGGDRDDEVASQPGGGSKFTLGSTDAEAAMEHAEERSIIITRQSLVLPAGLYLRPEERLLLESLGQRL